MTAQPAQAADIAWATSVAQQQQLIQPHAISAGWHWLQAAVEMAALRAGSWHAVAPACAGWHAFPRVAVRTPRPDPGAVAAARDFTAATLRRWGTEERLGDVLIVVSELLTNALRHALPRSPDAPRWPVRLGLLHAGACLLCAVADPSAAVPALQQPGPLDENGRGLHVVDSISDSWGATPPTRLGKVVWALFATGG
jgi:hypothetical protein